MPMRSARESALTASCAFSSASACRLRSASTVVMLSITCTETCRREVIHKALDIGAAALILVHNHPSGSPQPSRADIQITQRVIEASRLLGIVVHDHVIVGREGHVSLKAKGLI